MHQEMLIKNLGMEINNKEKIGSVNSVNTKIATTILYSELN
jgi:hypothetical protein